MKIQTIKKHYENLVFEREEIIDLNAIGSKELRARISEIVDLQMEIINRIDDMRISNATDRYLNFMYYDLNVCKSEYYLTINKREGRDLEYWQNVLSEGKKESKDYLIMYNEIMSGR